MPLNGRRHFYGAAAETMRRILADYARQRAAEKRGGPDLQRVALEAALNQPIDLRIDVVRLDEAIEALAQVAPDKARVVELRFCGGLSIQDSAEAMDISPATVKRHWTFARAWLCREMTA